MVLAHNGEPKIIKSIFSAAVSETEAHVSLDHHADLGDRRHVGDYGFDFGDFGDDRVRAGVAEEGDWL